MKIDSLKLQVEFDFDNLICTVTDMERGISDGYKHYNAFDNYSKSVEQISDFNDFIGKCVGAFLDDNLYYVCDDDEEYEEDYEYLKYISLYNADPNCDHNIVPQLSGGVKCTKCGGWFCY